MLVWLDSMFMFCVWVVCGVVFSVKFVSLVVVIMFRLLWLKGLSMLIRVVLGFISVSFLDDGVCIFSISLVFSVVVWLMIL